LEIADLLGNLQLLDGLRRLEPEGFTRGKEMQYLAQTVEAGGMLYDEYRYAPEVEEDPIVIAFKPKTHPLEDYGYDAPRFVPTDTVYLREQVERCAANGADPKEELETYRVVGLQLVEYLSSSGRLTEAPYWLIGVRCRTGSRDVRWLEEEELVGAGEVENPDGFGEF
jgi:hypothetical protein